MADTTVETTVTGGEIHGIAGAGTVIIENFTIYNRAIEEAAATDAAGEPIPPCPYPGLAYFGPGDADLFFGRDAAITRLAEAVGRQSLTALVGASGSGKSSVVLAGLAPRLHGAGGWRFSHFRIGTELDNNPFLALARALVPLYVASQSDTERLRNTKELAASLQTGELTLRDVFADCRSRNKDARILLIADQFEEAFTLVEDEALLHRFIAVLLAGFPDPVPGSTPDICLILTLRADFYGRALRHRLLADALQGHVENLGPMNREELQAAICCPAERAKVAFEPGIVETLLDVSRTSRAACHCCNSRSGRCGAGSSTPKSHARATTTLEA
jgi:Novel STAND NTPase 1